MYYRDWSNDLKLGYNLKRGESIMAFGYGRIWPKETFVTRNAEYQTFAHERLGLRISFRAAYVLFNNDQWNEHTVTVQTRYPRNTRLHEYTGNAGYSADKWTDYWGCITVTIPRNVNGGQSLVLRSLSLNRTTCNPKRRSHAYPRT